MLQRGHCSFLPVTAVAALSTPAPQDGQRFIPTGTEPKQDGHARTLIGDPQYAHKDGLFGEMAAPQFGQLKAETVPTMLIKIGSFARSIYLFPL
jgi:hypothetical protein